MEQEEWSIARIPLIERAERWRALVLPYIVRLAGAEAVHGRTAQEQAGFRRYRTELTISIKRLDHQIELLAAQVQQALAEDRPRMSMGRGGLVSQPEPKAHKWSAQEIADADRRFNDLSAEHRALEEERERVDAELAILNGKMA